MPICRCRFRAARKTSADSRRGPPSAQPPTAERQTCHERAENHGNRMGRVPEYKTGQADPDHFIDKSCRTGQKENEIQNAERTS